MRTGNIPWNAGCKIKCCKDCVAPKRHIGCHETCEDYKKEKAEHNISKTKEMNERIRIGRPMGKHDFDMLISTSRPKRRKG